MTRIVDLCARPSFLHEAYGRTPGTKAHDDLLRLNRRAGSREAEHFTRSSTADAFVAEARAAGIARTVVVGRDTPAVKHANDEIAGLVKGRRELAGVGSVNPQLQGPKAVIHEVERAVRQLGLLGVNLEPGAAGEPPIKADHPVLFPVYETCQALGAPVFLTVGPNGPSLDHADPAPVGRVAAAFPELAIVCLNGFWPYVSQAIGLAFRHANVFLAPDLHLFLPGGGLYVEAGNGFLRDQLMFASGYPGRAMKQTVDDFLALPWKDEVLDGILHGNAERVLKLDLPQAAAVGA